ncbi:MAG: hypothetical protein K6G51_08445 [Sphaerochaetaceae bacterium]|nr:hypothetical protein [Sphaerochaetaceae bacterium]
MNVNEKMDMDNYLIGKTNSGIYRIYNLKTDKSYLSVTKDIIKTRAEERFKLDLGMHPCKSLQDDYTKIGLELFVIELVKEENDESKFEALLEAVKQEYINSKIELYQ